MRTVQAQLLVEVLGGVRAPTASAQGPHQARLLSVQVPQPSPTLVKSVGGVVEGRRREAWEEEEFGQVVWVERALCGHQPNTGSYSMQWKESQVPAVKR